MNNQPYHGFEPTAGMYAAQHSNGIYNLAQPPLAQTTPGPATGGTAGSSRRSSETPDSGRRGVMTKEMEAAEAEAKKRKIQRACDVCRRKKIRCEGPMNSNSSSSESDHRGHHGAVLIGQNAQIAKNTVSSARMSKPPNEEGRPRDISRH